MFSDELNQSILESAPDAMVIVDAAGVIRYSNRQVSALFGYAAAELVGQPVEVLLPDRFRNRHVAHREHFDAEKRVRPMGSGLDLYARRRDGSEFPAEISLSPIGEGKPGLVAAAIRDVTERKRVEAELLAARQAADLANQGKSRFLAVASHDLRQPLQTLALLNGTLRRVVRGRSVIEAVEQQGQAISAMSKLLNSLLDISKLESGATKPEITDFAVAALFDELRVEFASLARSKGLDLQVEASDDCVRSDPSLVGQILKNLVANAIKYTCEGWVQIRCLSAPSIVRIEVLDTGVGIAPDQLARIFDEFYQVGVSPNSSRDGYGLGLSIVDRLVRLLRARLDVESEPGRGTRFALELPSGERVVAQRGETNVALPSRRSTARVLLVEDDVGVRNATRMLLGVEGYHVVAVGSLADALREARAMPAPPDIVVTDYHLGGGDTGLDVVSALRRLAGRELPAVVITGDTSSALKQVGEDHHLHLVSKPIDAEQFLAAVRRTGGGTGAGTSVSETRDRDGR